MIRVNMMTSSNGDICRVTGPLCGEFTGPGEFPSQRPVTRSFDVFFDQRMYKSLSKQPWGRWFETPSWSLWRHCNQYTKNYNINKPKQNKTAFNFMGCSITTVYTRHPSLVNKYLFCVRKHSFMVKQRRISRKVSNFTEQSRVKLSDIFSEKQQRNIKMQHWVKVSDKLWCIY